MDEFKKSQSRRDYRRRHLFPSAQLRTYMAAGQVPISVALGQNRRLPDLGALVPLRLAGELNEMAWCAGRDGRYWTADKGLQGWPAEQPSHTPACCTGHRSQHGPGAQPGATTTSAVVDERSLIGGRGAPLRPTVTGNLTDDHIRYSQSNFSARIAYQA